MSGTPVIDYSIQQPVNPLPIYIIGAGGIVRNAHLPAYAIAGFNVAGIYDIDINKAQALADKFNIPKVFTGIDEMLAQQLGDIVFDIAVPGDKIIQVLQQLPAGANVLMQKPMGSNIEEAKEILAYARQQQMNAAVNFQLRYAPFINAAREIVNNGLIGELCDIEVYVNVYTPWHLWKFLYNAPRVEILYHSIHYIDLVRNFLGEPAGVYAKTVAHPAMKELASVRSNIIMDYGNTIRANIMTNHCHEFGLQQQDAYIKFEGTKGAVKATLGLLMNYPKGVPDSFEYATKTNQDTYKWQSLSVEGSWFPHAFIGSMVQVMLAAEGSIDKPGNSVEDCIHTMACVEAAYTSSLQGGIKPDSFL